VHAGGQPSLPGTAPHAIFLSRQTPPILLRQVHTRRVRDIACCEIVVIEIDIREYGAGLDVAGRTRGGWRTGWPRGHSPWTTR